MRNKILRTALAIAAALALALSVAATLVVGSSRC
jgi:hypothetical protein